MSIKKNIISASPHVHSGKTSKSVMYDVVIALIPAFLVSVYVFGVSALITTAVAVVSCLLFEYGIQKFIMKTKTTITDGSALITGILLAFNLPSSIPIWMIIVGSLVAIGVAKLSFGGLGFNIFNPALVGRVFLLVSFPAQMTNWAVATPGEMGMADAISGATPLAILKEGLLYGESMSEIVAKMPSVMDMFIGFTGGSLGEMSVLALLLGGVYLLIRKVISWHIPIAMLGSMALFGTAFWLYDPELYANPIFHLVTGGAVLGAFFMATDMVTSPMTTKAMLVFAAMIGIITMIIRMFGVYPEGVSFAILIMNAFVPLLNKMLKPKRFGAKLTAKFV